MKVPSAALVPALIGFSEASAREDSWGRFTELAACDARLSTRAELKARDLLELSFEIGGEYFVRVPALVARVESDSFGYAEAELRFTDEAQKRRLAKTLLDLLSRRP